MSSIALIGKPNCGKSLLFNLLTQSGQKVANYPGVTVEVSRGAFQEHTIIDFPGIYSLHAISADERVAIEKFQQELSAASLSGILVVLDGTRLEASLVLALQILKQSPPSMPILLGINFLDTLEENNIIIDTNALASDLGVPVQLFSAKTGAHMEEISTWIQNPSISERTELPENLLQYATLLSEKHSSDAGALVEQQNRLDNVFLSSGKGIAFLVLTLILLFQSVFAWSTPAMDFIDWSITSTGEWVSSLLPEGTFQNFVQQAVFGGMGSFLVFVPQIFILTFLLALLEDSGYMARMAVICHRPLQWAGLSGKSVVPLLSGHACAIPAIYAARTIESPKKRLLTMIVIPLTSCAARLPVYGLLISVCIPDERILGGLLGIQGLAFFGLYLLGILGSLLVSTLLSRFTFKNTEDTPFVIELPSYRWPDFFPLVRRSGRAAWRFIQGAGAVIFTVNAIIWALGYFPNGQDALDSSYLASIGQVLEPLFAPLGLDWKFTVAILMSFLAREVFVGALGTMMGLAENDVMESGLVAQLQANHLPLGTAIGLLIFYVFAMQCVSTLSVLRQELNSTKAPILIFVGYNLLAYVLAFACVLLIG